MTRNDQVKDGFVKHYGQLGLQCGSIYSAFKLGAEWADNNPNEGLVSIDTVCKWLSENIEEFITGRDWDFDGKSLTNCLKHDLIINKYI